MLIKAVTSSNRFNWTSEQSPNKFLKLRSMIFPNRQHLIVLHFDHVAFHIRDVLSIDNEGICEF